MDRYTIVAEFTTGTKNGISTTKRLDREFEHEIPLTAPFLRKLLDDINYELIADSYNQHTGVINMGSISIQMWKNLSDADIQSFKTENCCQEDCGCKDFTTNENEEDFPTPEELTKALDEVIDLAENDDEEDYLK